ncbi:MAG TPA: glycoside hydrolase family 2 TIM barrel-domain containing protein [Terriglobia bacterium]|nr:glycoside hydrolase family 2 TIM barrel-domain containing protein [Terriglobia bacterium]
MVNRRSFVRTLGASTVLPALSHALGGFAASPSESGAGTRSRVDLNGQWERRFDGELYDLVEVPSSLRPSGYYQLRREFLLPELSPHQRAILHFEAITYFARVSVNGKELGTMGPYVPYEFDFTRQAKKGTNTVEVAIADLTPDPSGAGKDELALGVSPGWEAYGGIIRDVYVEVRPATFIDNVRFGYKLNADYTQAACRAQVKVSSLAETSGDIELVLLRAGVEVARAQKGASLASGPSEVEVEFTVNSPLLWSPEEPNLYELRAQLRSEHGEDAWRCRTGFREIVTRGPDFLLNGQRLILKGVARHDMWKEQGFTLTHRQMEQDMRSIKAMGANFIRQVHYPHHRYLVELGDEYGLLISEEPGFWQVDFQTMPRTMIELGYRIMERMIRRDWNSPCVFAWLLSNESNLTVETLREGMEICKRLDPIGRLVSAANDRPKEKAKPLFEQSGMDFFDQHPYTFDVDDFDKEAAFDGPSRPLTFTEWGGKAIGQSQIVMQYSVDRLLDLIETHRLAGHVFWSWQDMRQYSRIDAEMRDGVLESGVVTEGREPREVPYLELSRLFEGRRHETEPAATRPQVVPLKWSPWTRKSKFSAVDLQALVERPEGVRAWTDFEDRMAKFWSTAPMAGDQWKRTGSKFLLWQGSEVEIAGVTFRAPVVNGYVRPVVVTPGVPEVEIPVGVEGLRVHILGQVTLPAGFPVVGSDGEIVAVYTLRYASGKSREVPLRNGYEVAQSNLVSVATRVDPEATEAQRALLFAKDLAREQYQVLLYSLPLEDGKLASLHCQLRSQPSSALAIFAVTVEAA